MPRETIDRCIEYVKRSQNPDGGFMYMLARGPERLPALGGRRGGAVQRRHLRGPGDRQGAGLPDGLTCRTANDFNRESHYFYGHYYAVQAMWHAGGDYWKRWYPAIRDALIARQNEDGSWMRFDLHRVRHGHGLHHPANAEQLPADLPALIPRHLFYVGRTVPTTRLLPALCMRLAVPRPDCCARRG